MKYLFFCLFMIFVFPLFTFAQKQSVSTTAQVSSSVLIKILGWLYSEDTKQVIIGILVTLFTMLIVLGIYCLAKLL